MDLQKSDHAVQDYNLAKEKLIVCKSLRELIYAFDISWITMFSNKATISENKTAFKIDFSQILLQSIDSIIVTLLF